MDKVGENSDINKLDSTFMIKSECGDKHEDKKCQYQKRSKL